MTSERSPQDLARELADLRTKVNNLLYNRTETPYYRYPPTYSNTILPVGGIILWSGAIADIPMGWALCDGTSGTPDLRNSFVIGAGDTYAVAAAGGSATQAAHTGHGAHGNHSNHVVTQPSDHLSLGHNHAFTQPDNHGSHRHTAGTGQGTSSGTDFNSWQEDTSPQSSIETSTLTHTGGVVQTGGSHTHLHSGTAVDAHSAHSNDGSISAHGTNLPPYYALAYIMRIL